MNTEALKDKTVLVSGASGTVGVSVCRKLLECGAHVIGLYHRNPSTLVDLRETFSGLELFQADLLDADETAKVIKTILQAHSQVSVLISCAGKTLKKPAMLMSEAEELELMRLNFLASVQLSKTLLRPMFRQGAGSIVFIGSRAGSQGLAGQAVYAATKGALESYAKSLAQEVGSKNIRVNVVAPGAIEVASNQTYSEEENRRVAEMIALKRLAHPEEIALIAIFLASDESRYITGSVIAVDGGGRF